MFPPIHSTPSNFRLNGGSVGQFSCSKTPTKIQGVPRAKNPYPSTCNEKSAGNWRGKKTGRIQQKRVDKRDFWLHSHHSQPPSHYVLNIPLLRSRNFLSKNRQFFCQRDVRQPKKNIQFLLHSIVQVKPADKTSCTKITIRSINHPPNVINHNK